MLLSIKLLHKLLPKLEAESSDLFRKEKSINKLINECARLNFKQTKIRYYMNKGYL